MMMYSDIARKSNNNKITTNRRNRESNPVTLYGYARVLEHVRVHDHRHYYNCCQYRAISIFIINYNRTNIHDISIYS